MNKITVVGLGYIGLPTSVLIASTGKKVLGFDINEKLVSKINSGISEINENDFKELLLQTLDSGTFEASHKPSSADVFIIVVPTPINANKDPDLTYVISATRSIIPLIKKGDLVILESTSPVGTTEKISEIIFSNRPELRDEIFIAYCPERVLPGNTINELINNDRAIGGINLESTNKAIEFYKSFVKGELYPTNSRTAELCKLVENSSRDVQIAFANELSIICDEANIDVQELITLANKHPRVNILNPGCGVGGHCIAVDPYFIISEFKSKSKFISSAREANLFKTEWCIEKIKNRILNFELDRQKSPRLAILGLAYKPNIGDLRESPANYISEKLNSQLNNYRIDFVEPNINNHAKLRLTDLETALKNADIIVILVAHEEFSNIYKQEEQELIDFT